MQIHQIRSTDGTGTLSYLVVDERTGSALLIDPNREDVARIADTIRSENVRLTHIVDTHTHADHVSGAGELQQLFGSPIVMHENTKHKWKIIDEGDRFGIGDTLRANAKIPIDIFVNDGETIVVGEMSVDVLFTPGHTDNHIALRVEDALFTGDLLLIGQAGRSDLPGGNAAEQYRSLTEKILPLPDSTKMYPGHDYAENTFAFLGDEKKNNPFLKQRTEEEFIRFIEDFFPPLTEDATGGKTTLQCGVQRVAQPSDTFKNISAEELHSMLLEETPPALLDVREPIELMMTGAVEGVLNISVRQLAARTRELPADKSAPIVALCQSGSRSIEAAFFLQRLGYTNVMNLIGGTSAWMARGYPLVRAAVRI
ncbi:MAG: MBL fold metallo-hydrolase [Ignavibacteriae bacterium]|nr:MBL fold metallo-hydrolase [Ignavibacteriota bacterium]